MKSVFILTCHRGAAVSAQSKTEELLWNFFPSTDERRIPLRENPYLYLDLPTAGDAYGAGFIKESTNDFQFKRNDTVCVLVDKPALRRVYLDAEQRNAYLEK